MWPLFFSTVLITVLALYLPGYLLFRAFRCSRLLSFLIAPVYSLAGYAFVAQLYSSLGLACSGTSVILPVFGVALVGFIVRSVLKRKAGCHSGEQDFNIGFQKGDWKILVLFIALSFCLMVAIFVKDLDGAEGFLQLYDNYSHVGALRASLETSDYTILNTTLYPFATGIGDSPWGATQGDFYPALFYSFVATIVSFVGCPLMLGLNAVVTTIASILFPCSMFLLIRVIFKERKYLLAASICVLAFAAFPWGLMVVFGPLYPNMMALSLLPLFVALAMIFFSPKLGWKRRVVIGIVAIVSAGVMVLAHPNTFFAAYVLLAIYVARSIYWSFREKKPVLRVGAVVLFFAMLFVGWCVLFKMPALQGVIAFEWEALGSKSQVLADILAVSFTSYSAPQWLLAFFVLVGAVVSLFKRDYLWVTLTYALVAFLYMFGASSNGFLKHFLLGFWYTDTFRVAAVLAIAAIPVATMGIVYFCEFVKKLFDQVSDIFAVKADRVLALLVFGVVFLLVNFYPSFTLPNTEPTTTSFGIVHDHMAELQNYALDTDEQEFVEQVVEIVGPESVVINDPYDGSAFLYGTEGLQVFYRKFHGYDRASETELSQAIRNDLSSLSTNDAVADAVAMTGAQYVLLLDSKEGALEDDEEDSRKERWDPYRGGIEHWLGLHSIKESTPGFELVLSEGDMRLYKITATE